MCENLNLKFFFNYFYIFFNYFIYFIFFINIYILFLLCSNINCFYFKVSFYT